jgi:beta-lactamase superfamily II metal-dependent hydrolase
MKSEEACMNKNLIVQLYRVGFGDCIFVQIPDSNDTFTMLIDCGTSAKAESTLKPAVQHICSQLPKDLGDKSYLDLLIVTHPHADHIKGFDPAWFKGITIRRIWMTAFMNQAHPQAKKAQAFEQAAFDAARSLIDRPGLHLSEGAQSLLFRSLSLNNTDVLSALRKGLPTTYPRLYVARDVADKLSVAERAQHKLSLEKGVTAFRGFQEAETCLRMLAPEWDIDAMYLGKIPAGGRAFLDPLLLQTEAYKPSPESSDSILSDLAEGEAQATTVPEPTNISIRDFRLLRSRLLYSALAFSQEDDDLKNNVSVVLLLEWRGRRLLFTGDAEWEGTGLQQGQRNSSWDVMLSNSDVKKVLLEPLDLFKVAHHGSTNGTPFEQQEAVETVKKFVKPNKTHVVVSTVVGVHGKKNPVPYPALMKGLGSLAFNRTTYQEGEPELIDVPQPRRTDRESDSITPGVDYLEVIIKPAK